MLVKNVETPSEISNRLPSPPPNHKEGSATAMYISYVIQSLLLHLEQQARS